LKRPSRQKFKPCPICKPDAPEESDDKKSDDECPTRGQPKKGSGKTVSKKAGAAKKGDPAAKPEAVAANDSALKFLARHRADSRWELHQSAQSAAKARQV